MPTTQSAAVASAPPSPTFPTPHPREDSDGLSQTSALRTIGGGISLFRVTHVTGSVGWVCPGCSWSNPAPPRAACHAATQAPRVHRGGGSSETSRAPVRSSPANPPARRCGGCGGEAPLQVTHDPGTGYVIATLGEHPNYEVKIWGSDGETESAPTLLRTVGGGSGEGGGYPHQHDEDGHLDDTRPHRIGLQYPFVGVGLYDGTCVVYDMRTGVLCDTIPAPAAYAGTRVWMVLWGEPGQLFLLHGASAVSEWALTKKPDKAVGEACDSACHSGGRSAEDGGGGGRVSFELRSTLNVQCGGPVEPTDDPLLDGDNGDNGDGPLVDDVYFMSVTPTRLASCHESGHVRIHSLVTGQCTHDLEAHDKIACRIDLVGDMLTTSSFDGLIKRYRIDGKVCCGVSG